MSSITSILKALTALGNSDCDPSTYGGLYLYIVSVYGILYVLSQSKSLAALNQDRCLRRNLIIIEQWPCFQVKQNIADLFRAQCSQCLQSYSGNEFYLFYTEPMQLCIQAYTQLLYYYYIDVIHYCLNQYLIQKNLLISLKT